VTPKLLIHFSYRLVPHNRTYCSIYAAARCSFSNWWVLFTYLFCYICLLKVSRLIATGRLF